MKKREIILATANRGKVAELRDQLENLGLTVKTLADFPGYQEPEETGKTFAENALIKAKAAAKATGLIAIADDSGLVVDALAGVPGIYSSRYGEDYARLPEESRDQRNIRKLLDKMADVPAKMRGAHFETIIAAVAPDGKFILGEGKWPGEILTAPRGTEGFGYDPVFFDPLLNRSAAELSREEKNSHSHRGRAVKALLEKLPDFLK